MTDPLRCCHSERQRRISLRFVQTQTALPTANGLDNKLRPTMPQCPRTQGIPTRDIFLRFSHFPGSPGGVGKIQRSNLGADSRHLRLQVRARQAAIANESESSSNRRQAGAAVREDFGVRAIEQLTQRTRLEYLSEAAQVLPQIFFQDLRT